MRIVVPMWHLVETSAPVVRDLLSLGLAGLGAYLACLALRLGKQQAQIMEKQDRRIDEELAKQPILLVEMFASSADKEWIHYDVSIYNKGTRKCTGFKWYLLSAFSSGVQPQIHDDVAHEITHRTLEHEQHVRFAGYVAEPLFVHQRYELGTLRVRLENRSSMRWHIVADEGEWPGREKYGTLKLDDPARHVNDYVQRNREAIWWAQ